MTVTLTDGSAITLSGVAVGDKRWIQVAAPKDAALSAKANGRAFEIATYRYDGIFKPLEQLLVPKPAPATKIPRRRKAPARRQIALRREEACSRAAAVIDGASAGFGRRAAALIYDAFLLAALLMIFTGRRALLHARRCRRPGQCRCWAYVYRAGLVLVIAGYYVLNWLRSGQTLGMRAWRIRAVMRSEAARSNGMRPFCGRASGCLRGRRRRWECCGCTSTPIILRCTIACPGLGSFN